MSLLDMELKDNIPTELTNRTTLVGDDDTMIMINYLCTLPSLMAWPSVLFEIVGEYCRDIPPVCYVFGGNGADNSADNSVVVAPCGRIIEGKWCEIPSMSVPRVDCGVCCIGDYIYVTGGQHLVDGKTLATIEKLHVPTLKWSIEQSMPQAITRHGCIAVDDFLYCIGGDDNRYRSNNYMYRYEPKSGSWTTLPPTKHDRYMPSFVVLNRRIYALGGHNVLTCEMFDLDTNQWNDIAQIPEERYCACAVVVEGNIMLLGGMLSENYADDTIDEYSPLSNSWKRLSWTLPFARERFASWYDPGNKSLYIALGYPTRDCSNVYMRRLFDDNVDKWTIVTNCDVRRSFGWTITTI